MKFKIGDMSSKSILRGIFITGLIYFIFIMLNFLSGLLLDPGASKDSTVVAQFNYITYIIITKSLPIIGLILFKLICEILYKIVKACEIIIQNHNN